MALIASLARPLFSRDEITLVSCLAFSFLRHLRRSHLSLILRGGRASDTNQSTRSGSGFLRCSSLPKKVPLDLTMTASVGEPSLVHLIKHLREGCPEMGCPACHKRSHFMRGS